MLNYETLLSSYDDKLTLMQWLKKVEAALKDASAVSFKVNKRGDATLTFSVVFEDGSELETSPIILQQGESVQGAAIRNGHLILTLTNGDELDAGNLGAVSGFSINDSQHLIVAYQNGTIQDLGAIFTGDVSITGNLAAAAVKTASLTSDEGEIRAQKPVVEVMTGYNFTKLTQQYGNLNISYAGAVKNGNKLTLALAGTYEKTSDGDNENIGYFSIPTSVAAKMFPFHINDIGDVLEFKVINFVDTSNATILGPAIRLIKNQYGSLFIYVQSVTGLTTGHTYYFRYEVTFLLSDNLAV